MSEILEKRVRSEIEDIMQNGITGIALWDIDRTWYRIDNQLAAWMQRAYSGRINSRILTHFTGAPQKFIQDYLVSGQRESDALLKQFLMLHPEMADADLQATARKLTLFFLREFGKSEEFVTGSYYEITRAAKHIRKLKGINLAVSSRGNPGNPNMYYDDCINRTDEWVKRNKLPIDGVYYFDPTDKVNAVPLVQQRYGVGIEKIVGMADDDYRVLPGFVDLGIPAVHIRFRGEAETDGRYRSQIIPASDHEEAGSAMLGLFLQKLRR